jgi:hypothetical protein
VEVACSESTDRHGSAANLSASGDAASFSSATEFGARAEVEGMSRMSRMSQMSVRAKQSDGEKYGGERIIASMVSEKFMFDNYSRSMGCADGYDCPHVSYS